MKPIHEDIPIDRAWQVGRRIYVACGYESALGEQLRGEFGAHWDRNEKRLWVGSGKKQQVIAAVQADGVRRARIAEIKRTGRAVAIPFEATALRELAKDKDRGGAVWDNDRKAWVFPPEPEYDAAYEQIVAGVDELRQRAREAAVREEQQRQQAQQQRREAEQAQARAERAERRTRVLAESGRTPTGEEATLVVVSTQVMNKATAWQQVSPLGEVLRLDDGRRGVVVDRDVWFTGSEMASSACWHPQTHDQAHWDLKHVLAVVEPTAVEIASDASEHAYAADVAEIHRLVRAVSRTGTAAVGWSRLDPASVAGVIDCRYGSTAIDHHGGTVTLTRDGHVVFQHPGYYDDFARTERILTDSELVVRVRAVLAAGSRTRRYHDQTVYRYEVSVHDEGEA